MPSGPGEGLGRVLGIFGIVLGWVWRTLKRTRAPKGLSKRFAKISVALECERQSDMSRRLKFCILKHLRVPRGCLWVIWGCLTEEPAALPPTHPPSQSVPGEVATAPGRLGTPGSL